jgi:hypothetical protein
MILVYFGKISNIGSLVHFNLRFLHVIHRFLIHLSHRNLLPLLHPTQQQVARSPSLVILRCCKCVELLIMPLPCSHVSARAIREHRLVFSTEEICNRVAVLGGVQRNDSVDARLHGVAARKAEGVTDVDDCGADFGCDEAEFLGS